MRRGDVLALVLENRLEFVVAAWAGMRSGLYVAPADPRLAAPELAAALQHADPAAVVTSATYAASTRAALAGDSVAPKAAHGSFWRPPLPVLTAGEDLAAAVAGAARIDPGDERLGARMIFSSGSTGRPKAIRLALVDAHPSTAAERLGPLFERLGFGADTVLVSPAPLYHAAPFSFTQGAQALGGTVVVHDRFDAARVLEALERHRATHLLAVPTMLRRLLALPAEVRAAADLSSLRVAITGAAPCPPELKARLRAWWGPVLHEYYGASEGYGLTHISPAEMVQRPASVGRAVHGTIHVTDPLGEQVAPGVVGRVWFAGTAPIEYAGDAERSAATRDGRGWSTIGDRGWLDEAGYLHLTGREDGLIISGGVNVAPEQVEAALESHPHVATAGVLGLPDEDLGQRVVALVAPAPGAPAADHLRRAVLEHAAGRLGRPKRPRELLVVDALPELDNGKLARRRLPEAYAAATGPRARY